MATLLRGINIIAVDPVEQTEHTDQLFLPVTQWQCYQGQRRLAKLCRQAVQFTRLPGGQLEHTAALLAQRGSQSLTGIHGQTRQ